MFLPAQMGEALRMGPLSFSVCLSPCGLFPRAMRPVLTSLSPYACPMCMSGFTHFCSRFLTPLYSRLSRKLYPDRPQSRKYMMHCKDQGVWCPGVQSWASCATGGILGAL